MNEIVEENEMRPREDRYKFQEESLPLLQDSAFAGRLQDYLALCDHE